MRFVIYARFSSANQSQASIDDQIEVCTRYIDKHGWVIVDTYADFAVKRRIEVPAQIPGAAVRC